jgi:xanthine dehydrogenase accessory factor
MFDEFLAKVTALRSEGSRFAVATVVRFQPPVSGRPGDKAIIQPNGQISGWIGGGCMQPIVVREALRAIEDGKPKLVRIAPGRDSGAEYGVANYTMTCHGGGGMEIYIEPVLPPPQLLIFGRSLAAQALCKLGNTIGYSVIMVGPGLDRLQFHDANRIVESWDVRSLNLDRETYIVVSTQGEGDEEALEQAVRTNVPYVSFIASPTKAEKIVQFLADRGTAPEALSRVKAPAGLDICALGPEEIAISILAEIILIRRSGKPLHRNLLRKEASATNHAMDPICGMTVDAGGAGYFSEYKGRKYYFCSAGCKQEFDKQPEAHRIPSPPSASSHE